jgi:hypothetical protein
MGIIAPNFTNVNDPLVFATDKIEHSSFLLLMKPAKSLIFTKRKENF